MLEFTPEPSAELDDRLESFIQTSNTSFWNLCLLLSVDPSLRGWLYSFDSLV